MPRFLHTRLFVLTIVLSLHAGSQTPLSEYSVILGRPTDSSVTVSVLFEKPSEFFIEYGNSAASLSLSTNHFSTLSSVPVEMELTGLWPDQRYYYRLLYKNAGLTTYQPSPVYSFHTQRTPGSTFTFTIEADEHLYDIKGVKSMYMVTLQNQAKDQPDFMLSLGDIFGDDHYWQTITSSAVDSLHKAYRPLLGSICHSIPFYLCLGNHEGENDYYYNQNPGNNLCVWGTQSRKQYYPNPYPNRFYSGNNSIEPYDIGNPENYYAWIWGDAQFIVLDVYRDQCDTSDKPIRWEWSLGLTQYTWLQNTLEKSRSKYKFVFAHHIRGQGRGGVTNATQFEWGGMDGNNYKFSQYRQGWAKPIHKLFVDNGVTIFFQGHDHLFAHEILDGITYQEVPMPSDSTYMIGQIANAGAYTSDTIPGTGHVRVTVSPEQVKVDFVRAYLPVDTVAGIHRNGEIAFSYTVVGLVTGVKQPQSMSPLLSTKLFPNPANDVLHISIPDFIRDYQVRILNTTGQVLLQTRSREINVSRFAEGLYYVELITKQQRGGQKIYIHH